MGVSVSCCEVTNGNEKNESEENKEQLEIEKIINEDKARYPNVKVMIKKNYDMGKLRRIQKFYKNYFCMRKFRNDVNMIKNVVFAEMRGNVVKNFKTPTKNYYLPEEKKGSREYTKEIKQMFRKNWKYVVDMPPMSVEGEDVYSGSWNLSKKYHGYGVLYKNDGSKYEGFWENGLLEGEGRYYSPTGEFFEGNFLSGVPNGYGEFYHSSGVVYKGDWKNDHPEGNGIEVFEDQSNFVGLFKCGKKVCGRFTWNDKNYYDGEFINDYFHGRGVYQWDDMRYEGEWKNGQMEGKGIFRYQDGSVYEGEFVNNRRNGHGRYTWNENKYLECNWLNGVQHGKGIYYKNGTTVDGMWSNGNLTDSKTTTSQTVPENTNLNQIKPKQARKGDFSLLKK